MTITLPTGWGPATVLSVLYALAVVVAGIIEIAQGDMSMAEYLGTEQMKVLGAILAGLSIGRGASYIGSPESVATPKARTREVK